MDLRRTDGRVTKDSQDISNGVPRMLDCQSARTKAYSVKLHYIFDLRRDPQPTTRAPRLPCHLPRAPLAHRVLSPIIIPPLAPLGAFRALA